MSSSSTTEDLTRQLEREVLARLVARPSDFFGVDLEPRMFSTAKHRRIFEVVGGALKTNENPDIVELEAYSRQNGGVPLNQGDLLDLMADLVEGNLDSHVQRIHEAALDREVRRRAAALHASGKRGVELLNEAMTAFVGLSGSADNQTVHISVACGEVLDRLERVKKGDSDTHQTGIREFDEWRLIPQGEIIVVCGRPGHGKTGLMHYIASRLAARGEPGLIFPTEMSREKTALRFVSAYSRVNSRRIATGRVSMDDWRDVSQAASKLDVMPVYIDDKSRRTAALVRSIREARHRYGIRWVLLDYLQKCIKGDKPRNEMIQLMNAVDMACKETDPALTLIAGSQLNRDVEKQPDRIPRLEHLRESSNIEDDASVVIGVQRPAKYADIKTVEYRDDPNLMRLFIPKNRNGEEGSLRMHVENGVVVGPRGVDY